MPQKNKHVPISDNSLFNSIDEAVLLIDKEYNVISSNMSFKKYFPVNTDEAKCYQLIGKQSPCQICTCSLSSRKKSFQEKEEFIDNRYFLVSSNTVRKSPVNDFYYVETYKDITYSKKLEDSLLSKNTILENNLNIARQVQQSLLPRHIESSVFRLDYRYYPCEKLGGDFFNAYRIDENRYGFFIADVSGHGVSAAMMTMFLNSSINKSEKSPAVMLLKLFKIFNDNQFLKNHYIAIFLSVIDIAEKSMTYCNAGLNSPPVVFNRTTGKINIIEESGFPISNWVEEPGYSDKKLIIEKDDKVFFYTDGITDARNSRGIPYGQDRLIRSLTEGNPSTKITLDRIVSYLEDYIEGSIKNLRDDISLVMMEI